MRTEQRAISVAHQYAVANGYAPDDLRAAGLVLVGMVIAAGCSPALLAEIDRGYRAAHPDAVRSIDGWVDFLTEAAVRPEEPPRLTNHPYSFIDSRCCDAPLSTHLGYGSNPWSAPVRPEEPPE